MAQTTFLVTGSAGFIGFHLSQKLLESGAQVIGFDNLNDYYPREIKLARNSILSQNPGYQFIEGDLVDQPLVEKLFAENNFQSVFHLAAQAGVRYSLTHPRAYLKSNIDGTLNILEAARHCKAPPSLLIASSSSVYGLSDRYPLREDDRADQPVALYGATKRADELMAHSYSHLFGLRTTLLRFFTVYGPWGRPDMALFMFTRAMLRGEEIEVFNHGDMIRDFTYVDDIVEGMIGLERERGREGQPAYDVFNIGCANPTPLMDFIRAIESNLKVKAKLKMMPFQPGDVYKTFADVSKLSALTGYQPKIRIEQGIPRFLDWYCDYFKVARNP